MPHKTHKHFDILKVHNGVAGAISGIITRAVTQPLDVIKIRLQLQVEPISKYHTESKYKGFLQALYLIFKEEGIRGLWRSHVAGQCHSALFGLFQTFELLKHELDEIGLSGEEHLVAHFMAGGLAGCVATTMAYPLDVIRARLVAQGNKVIYSGIFHGFGEICKNEGMFGLYRGLTPALYIAGPHAGLQFYFYKLYKNTIRRIVRLFMKKEKHEVGRPGKILAGCLAGSSAKFITHPFDVARRRMQIQEFQYARQGFGKSFHCHGMLDCFTRTVSAETSVGLFKGLTPSLVKAAITTALHFTIYEEILYHIMKMREE